MLATMLAKMLAKMHQLIGALIVDQMHDQDTCDRMRTVMHTRFEPKLRRKPCLNCLFNMPNPNARQKTTFPINRNTPNPNPP